MLCLAYHPHLITGPGTPGYIMSPNHLATFFMSCILILHSRASYLFLHHFNEVLPAKRPIQSPQTTSDNENTLRINLHALLSLRTLRTISHKINPLLNLLTIKQLESLNTLRTLLLDPNNTHTRILNRQLLILRQTLLQSPQPMLNQLLPPTIRETLQVPLQIRPRHLGSRTNSTSHHLLRHATRLKLK